MTARSGIASVGAVLILLGSALIATMPAAAEPAPAANASASAAAPGAAGRDYATDVFADPWDYSNAEDIIFDNGLAIGVSNPSSGSGIASVRFTDNGYLSPIWGGWGGPLFTGRDGAKPGSALNTGRYRTVSFHAYSDRDVSAGVFWFNCPGGAVNSNCGGGAPLGLKAGWNTYVITPGASQFGGWPLGWGGSVNGLRLAVSPGGAGSDFALDWFRVSEPNSGAAAAWSNPGGGAGEVIWDADSDAGNNTTGQTNWGVLGQVSGTSGSVDLSVLPAGTYRIAVRVSGTVGSWSTVTLDAPLPRFITPNAVGDRDYAGTVLGNPWDMNGADDVARVGNATNVTYSGGQLAATNTSNDPFVALKIGAGGIDTGIYRNFTVTSDYDGAFDLKDAPGGGTHGRVIWSRPDGSGGQTGPVLTYSGPRTVSFDLGLPDREVLEPNDPGTPFTPGNAVDTLRWDPNEDPGSRRWYVKDVQLRSDFATTGSFPITWQDAAYQSGATATVIADNDRGGCNGITVASGVPVNQGTNTTVWNTAGVAAGRYWLCLTITRGNAVTSGYAEGVLVVGANPPTGPAPDPNPIGSWDRAGLSGTSYEFGGWAFDPNTPQESINVDVYDRRPDGSQVGVRFSTGGSRGDVAAAFPGVGGNTGFNGAIALAGPGRHTVCAYAINTGPGENRLISCRDVDVPGPIGSLDGVVSDGESTLSVYGWASDPGAPTAAEDVHFYITGPAGTRFGLGRTSGGRPDVQEAYPWAGPNSGFFATVPAAGEGQNLVCAYAINVNPPRTNPQIGCRTVTVRNAFGYLDGVWVSGGQIVANGWAINPNRPNTPVELHVYDYGPTGTRGYPGFLGNRSRPDVGAAFPGYGSNQGFSASVPATGSGRHTVCVYAITTGGGAGNPLLGCVDVTV